MSGFDAVKGAENLSGDIYGLRTFRVTPNGDLAGLTYKQPIISGLNRARCGAGRDHRAPSENCMCGFYALDEDNQLWADGVIAVVRLSGRILVCERGLRAEVLEIVALAEMGKPFADHLGLPWFTTRAEMLSVFPLTKISRPAAPEHDRVEPKKASALSTSFRDRLRSARAFASRQLVNLVGFALALGVVAGMTFTFVNFYGLSDAIVFLPLATVVMTAHILRRTTTESTFEIAGAGATVVLLNQSEMDLTKLPDDSITAIGVLAFLFVTLHISNIILEKLKTRSNSVSFKASSMIATTAASFPSRSLAPNPVKTTTDHEGR